MCAVFRNVSHCPKLMEYLLRGPWHSFGRLKEMEHDGLRLYIGTFIGLNTNEVESRGILRFDRLGGYATGTVLHGEHRILLLSCQVLNKNSVIPLTRQSL